MKRVTDNITVEDARIGYRNFSGKPGRFNKEGERSFAWFIDSEELAHELEDLGWKVRWKEVDDGVDIREVPYMNVAVRFGAVPPKIMLIDNRKHRKIPLDEESVGMLDWSEIDIVDMIIRPYNWEAQGKTGVKAYLKVMYVILIEDDFGGKYADIPTVGETAIPTIDARLDDDIPF